MPVRAGQITSLANLIVRGPIRRMGETKPRSNDFGAKTFFPDPSTAYYLLSVGIRVVIRRRLYHRHSRSRGWAIVKPTHVTLVELPFVLTYFVFFAVREMISRKFCTPAEILYRST